MKKLYFKVYTDFTQYIPIDDSELEKALFAFLVGEPVIFENGATNRIEKIVPDFTRAAGWSSDYKPSPDDTLDLDRVKPMYIGYVSKIKDKIQYLINTKQTHLIGKNVEIPELAANHQNQVSPEVKALADKMKLK